MIFHSRLSSLSVSFLVSSVFVLSPTTGASGGKPECAEIEARGLRDLAGLLEEEGGSAAFTRQERQLVEAVALCEDGYAHHGYKDVEQCVAGELDGMADLIKPFGYSAQAKDELLAAFEDNARSLCARLLANPYLN